MKKLYIFDFDGTLVNSIYDSIYCVNKALKLCGKPTYKKDLKTLYYQDFRDFLKDNDAGKETEVYTIYNKIYQEYEKPNTFPYNNIKTVLKELQNKNITLAICSNREEKFLKYFTKKLFKDINFKYISGYKKNIPDKPNPYRLNEIIKKENIKKEEVLYFGDKDADINAAKNAGIDMVLVKYGQGNIKDYENTYPIKIIETPIEILDL
ncbi:HAD family hydrolase [Methanobrevibacter wolinii]|uniref:HAD family hydrolase n=1 Tax=Methanobrevibacter wolinii TaxID=190977 RepID=UPI0005B295D2|nr:HAD family hydrolase [Methanobrevibacter wolinii]MDD5960103.1 HAD family hydrolase [Methanobrevibacter wolinii]